MKKNITEKTIQNLQNQLKDLDEKFKRILADYQNQQKRHQDQTQTIAKYANESLLDKLLPVQDDLQRAQKHLKDEGLNHIVSQFNQVLDSEGLIKLETNNKPFNPETMDCAEVVTGKKDMVVETLTAGFMYKDKLLRPAKVTVGNGKIKKH